MIIKVPYHHPLVLLILVDPAPLRTTPLDDPLPLPFYKCSRLTIYTYLFVVHSMPARSPNR